MNDTNPYQSPRFPSSRAIRGRGAQSMRSRVLAAVVAGVTIGHAVSLLSVIVVGSTVGYMDFEMSGLFALFFGTVGAVPAAVAGAFVGAAKGQQERPLRLLVAVAFGGICSGAVYSFIVVPQATVPAVVVFWVGVVPVASGLVTGGVGGLIGLGDRLFW
jgi:hypothetical protein